MENKRNSNDEHSSDKDDNDSVPGLQDRNQPDSSSENDDEYNRSDSEDYLITENDDKYYQTPYNITSMNSTITSEWIDNTDDKNYDGDSDIPSLGDLLSSLPCVTTSPSAMPSAMPSPASTTTGKPSLVSSFRPSLGDPPRSVPRVTMSPGAVPSAAPSSESH